MNYYRVKILAQVEMYGQCEVARALLEEIFPQPNSEEAIAEWLEQNGLHATKLAGDIILIARKRRINKAGKDINGPEPSQEMEPITTGIQGEV